MHEALLASHSCTVGNFIELLLQRRWILFDVGQATNIGEELSLNIDANYKITIFGNS